MAPPESDFPRHGEESYRDTDLLFRSGWPASASRLHSGRPWRCPWTQLCLRLSRHRWNHRSNKATSVRLRRQLPTSEGASAGSDRHGRRRAGVHVACCRVAREAAMKVVKAAAVQLSPVLYSRERQIDKVVRTIDALGQQGVQFATFP